MNKILILDKDGTLTNTVSGKKFVQSPIDQKIIPGMDKALILAKRLGYKIGVASNQGGVKAGFKTERDTLKEFNCLHVLYPEIDLSVFCPDDGDVIGTIAVSNGLGSYKRYTHQDFDLSNIEQSGQGICQFDSFRKPGAGMIQYIISQFPGAKNVIFVGDRPEDEQAALNANVTFLWADVFGNDYQRFL